MSEEERAVLLARSEQELKMLEEMFDRFLKEGNSPVAWAVRNQYNGAIYMLKALGLMTVEDMLNWTKTLLDRYMAARPKEAG